MKIVNDIMHSADLISETLCAFWLRISTRLVSAIYPSIQFLLMLGKSKRQNIEIFIFAEELPEMR